MHDYWPSHYRRRLRAASTLTPLQRWRVAVKASTLKVFLTTDASKVGMGAWIGVGTTKENAQRVAYDSRSFNSAQRNYSMREREFLAIVHSLDQWRPFLYGIPVYAFTDHFTLKWFLGQGNLCPNFSS
ncbi:hypothetical protein C343_02605 [Cryptococcus neoformans C23]|uniref:Reverse transcriptase RNase H-like domain-containing protein n=2 Tax=Cryptococcus neoformans TaxID=5207 RepID=A0A854QFG4_CRYNE|nr:hypothetical protein CNAG_05263 [Cryptococcus neoformans var. grubii H99]AUB24183.1 hypothetical protein CKF44_05263 [Cryptococcus neoformans var. grubii]OWZ32877.1 hypothetical protein C347_02673 [Cryptococcus neoformans var. grubii AD2-60a]OWZ45171.1 hypothetical protein C343_02605 [Cryptococcus neoformans var. grubii C23]OWZ45860.1 hypothetical protein C353_02508 [Cryptococcus neoformans var. grubii AD1-83a]OWZ54873.1 hypothetical protein C368_03101 [Cryptococcus neoformans var. grubii 1|eukprot:XP_012048811.1 hypothetical protein CNAG_05263 [Cryptococcus neoformans var. grubii H99]